MKNHHFNSQQFQQTLRKYSKYGYILVGLSICFLILGLSIHLPWVSHGLLGFKPIKFNTALCLILLSLSGWLQYQSIPYQRSLINLCTAIILLIATLTLIEYIFQLNLGIDQLFLPDLPKNIDHIWQGVIIPGRMAFNTALNFLILGLVQFLVNLRRPFYFTIQLLAIICFLISLLALCGYIYGNAEFYHVESYPDMALYTCASFLILSLSNLFLYPERALMRIVTSNTAGGVIARRLLPVTILISPIVAGLILTGYQQQVYTAAMGFNLLAIIYIIIFGSIIWQSSYFLDRVDSQRQEAEIAIKIQREELISQNESLAKINHQLEQEISKRQQLEKILRDTGEQYLAILEQQTDLICRFLPDGTLLFVNEAYCNYYGKIKEELIGHTYEPVIFPDDIPTINQMLNSLCLEHPIATIEHRAIVQGEIRWMQWINRAIFDDQGNFIEFQSVGRDISDRKQAEVALQAKTEELDRFFSVSLDLLAICDYEGYFTRVNNQWSETLGYRVEEIEGTKFFDYVHPEDMEKTQAVMSVLTDEQQRITNFVNRYRCRDGSYRWIEWRSVPVGNLIYGAARDISDRIKAETALRQSEARFRAFFEQAAVGVSLCNNQGGFIQFNPRFCDIVGYSASELKERTFRDITHPDDLETDWHLVQQMWQGKIQTFSKEKRYIRSNGEIQWVNLTASLVKNTEGIPEYSIAIIVDISDRIKAEAARRENEELFRTIFEKGSLGMAIVSLDYHFLKVNLMLCQMLGYDETELTNLTFTDITYPEDLNQDLQLTQQLYAGEIPYYKLQKRYLTKNNDIKWVMLTGSIIRDQQGNPLYYLAMIEDISNIYEELRLRQQAEAILRKYERIVSATTDGICLVDCNYIYQAVNQAYLNWHQKTHDQIIGHSISEIIGQETFEKTIKSRLDHCFAGNTEQYEMWYDYPRIGSQFLSVTYAPYLEQNQTVSGAVISIRNITELQQKQEIEAALQEKEVLLKEIHHRVKNNLQVIYSLLNLQSRSIKDPVICDKFKESQTRIQSMALIHEHLYRSDDFSQIELSKYLHELVDILHASYKLKNLVVDINIDIQENFFLDIDTAVPCGLIINELVSNALKYAFNSNNKGMIYIGAKADEQQNLVLTIADNGKGLSPDFDWEQSPTLGLKLVKNLTNQLRGKITVEHELGTKFTLVLTRIITKN